MTKETLLTCLIALRSDLVQCKNYWLNNPGAPKENSAVPRIEKAILEVENEINKFND